jgi:hypothetical protein
MKKLNISQVDAVFANGSYPIKFLLFYKNRIGSKNIRTAMKKLSVPFWPLFGEYRDGIIQFDRYSEKNHFDEIRSAEEFDPRAPAGDIFEKYDRFIPSHMEKQFFLKIIQPKNGSLLIAKQNHMAGDGYSYFYFLSVLAKTAQGTRIPFQKTLIRHLYKPHHRRTVLKEFRFRETGSAIPEDRENPILESEAVPREKIREMIKGVSLNSNRRVSSNDLLSAVAVKKLADGEKHGPGEDFHLTIPVDVRRYIPEYGPKFFGNALLFHHVRFQREEAEKESLEKLALKIRSSMPAVTKDGYLEFLGGLEKTITEKRWDEFRPFDPRRGCLVTNLSKMPAQRLNFGTGVPDLIFPLTVEKNSAGVLADRDHLILRISR